MNNLRNKLWANTKSHCPQTDLVLKHSVLHHNTIVSKQKATLKA